MTRYTKEQLSKYFGVHSDMIDQWTLEGRLVRSPRKNDYKGDSYWQARTGELHLIQDIVDEWEREDRELNKSSKGVDPLLQFEQKYGGPFEETLAKKPLSKMSAQEESDASVWSYLIRQRGFL